jgi:hypothetical protein
LLSFQHEPAPTPSPGRRLSSCMEMKISDTLDVVSRLKSPVIRTCHIGNNTSNNFGWLRLAKNSYMGQFDHTLYGVDDHNVPWAVLGDGGRVEACYDHRGNPVPEAIGRHANELKGSVRRNHLSIFNYSLFLQHEGEDLLHRHLRLATRICEDLGVPAPVCRSTELHQNRRVVRDAVESFFRRNRLDRIFNRWARTTRSGRTIMLRPEAIEQSGGDVLVRSTEKEILFEGSFDALMDRFFEGMERVSNRLLTGQRYEPVSYPWVTNIFGHFLLVAAKEHQRDPRQEEFWHSGASGTHYYVNEEGFQAEFEEIRSVLVADGLLPDSMHLHVIPTFSCQLFATSPESLAALGSLLSLWREHLQDYPLVARRVIESLRVTTEPLPVLDHFCSGLPTALTSELARRLAGVNACSANRLPVAYMANSPAPAYNKYGICQASLLGKEILIPEELREMSWGEAELLVKTLAWLTAGARH